ncbi:ATP-binding protein [Streptomyces pactum]|uniref:ATP-binding protein n=1 Tax=Streptomyces pactum TaxID=68249 RepID=A0ABS0NQU1_9ACTN|nr:ATP-binding protein [Streptomyces pactum]MBH5337571.1 ATP-binding protein [Streptomyces pactum]
MKRQPAHRGGTDTRWPESTPATEGERGRGTVLEIRLHRAELSGVADVRRRLRTLLDHWGAPGRADAAELLISELVTNALVHSGGGAVVTATLDAEGGGRGPARLHVEVRDFTGRRPTPRPPTPEGAEEGTSGRGLLLVNALADAWGVRPQGVGKVVWFDLYGTAA